METVEGHRPAPLAYRRYWDNEEYREGLRDEIAAAIAAAGPQGEEEPFPEFERRLADVVMERVFSRVKLHTWCDLTGCAGVFCRPTHYAFRIQTVAREFGPPQDPDDG